jgi:protein gp37
MAESSIEWTASVGPDGTIHPGYTFNPWIGCAKVAAGCAHCYAERDFDTRRGVAKWGVHGTRVKTGPGNWNKPLAWNRKAQRDGVRLKVFCASLADVFEDWGGTVSNMQGEPLTSATWETAGPMAAPLTLDDLRYDLFELIDATPHLDWLLLTKRPENIRRMWPCDGNGKEPGGEDYLRRDNVWLLTSVAKQEDADRNVPELLKCRDLAPVLGLSCEPLLGPVDLLSQPRAGDSWDWLTGERESARGKETTARIDWVIAGGESGPGAQPMHPDWARSLRRQCAVAGVPYFFKQWGEWAPQRQSHGMMIVTGDRQWLRVIGLDGDEDTGGNGPWCLTARVGKKAAGRLLDGELHGAFPVAPGAGR